jgi:hypothetical protein
MNAQEPNVEFTITVTRKDTGAVETYTVIGTLEPTEDSTNGENS